MSANKSRWIDQSLQGWRHHLIEFSQNLNRIVYMIHHNAEEFALNYPSYSITPICTSVEAPNMNSIAERFVKSARSEALDFFLLISERQIWSIVTEYIEYYNALRPHQGIDQNIPQGYTSRSEGEVRQTPMDL